LPMAQKVLIFPIALIGTLYTTQYLLTSSTYYDEYDG